MTSEPLPRITPSQGLLALSPVMVFLASYLVISLVVGDFYKMPIAVALLISSAWAVAIYRGRPLHERIETFSRAAANSSILFMVWIFILAGAFASLAKGIGAIDATVAVTLRFFPADYIVPAIFMAACFISLAVGTSVGTVVALVPLVVQIAQAGGGNVPFFVAAVLGGAFFGDNLSFISDTTIAATRTQGCSMADKFKANLWIALPAALATLALYLVIGHDAIIVPGGPAPSWLLALPYLLVIVLAVTGLNVTVVLGLGILCALLLGLCMHMPLMELAGMMGAGIDSMGNLIIITLMAAGLLGVVKAAGGITFLLGALSRSVRGPRGAQACIALLVSLVNLCTANNTVAIITVGSISRSIAERFKVDPRKAASLLDSASCIVQCLIPYGAQTLLATALSGISPAAPWPYLYYPWALALMVALSIAFLFPRRLNSLHRP